MKLKIGLFSTLTLFTFFIFAEDKKNVLFDENFSNSSITSYTCREGGTCAGISYLYTELYKAQKNGMITFSGGAESGKWTPPSSIQEARGLIEKALRGEKVEFKGLDSLSQIPETPGYESAFSQVSGQVQNNFEKHFPDYFKNEAVAKYNTGDIDSPKENLKLLESLTQTDYSKDARQIGFKLKGEPETPGGEPKVLHHAVSITDAKKTADGYRIEVWDPNKPDTKETWGFDQSGNFNGLGRIDPKTGKESFLSVSDAIKNANLPEGASFAVVHPAFQGTDVKDYAMFDLPSVGFTDATKTQGYEPYSRNLSKSAFEHYGPEVSAQRETASKGQSIAK